MRTSPSQVKIIKTPTPAPHGRVPLERAFSKLGLASRTVARQWILQGKVTVNGRCLMDPLHPVVPETVKLKVEGRVLRPSQWRLIVLNKPKGVVTTRSDEKNRPTVFTILGQQGSYLHPVGRLDMATTGLLLLTNDTRLSSWLTDPRNHVPRVYVATVQGLITEKEIDCLTQGIVDQGEWLKANWVKLRKGSNRESHVTLELTQGKNREIRRMFAAIGHEVTALKRIAFGGLTLGELQPGAYRDISREKVCQYFGDGWIKE